MNADKMTRDGMYSVQMHEKLRTIGSFALHKEVDGKICAFVGRFHQFRAILQFLEPVLTQEDEDEFYFFGCEVTPGEPWKDDWLYEVAHRLHSLLDAETETVVSDVVRTLLIDFKYIIIYKARTTLDYLDIFPERTREKTKVTMLAYIDWFENMPDPPVSKAIAEKNHGNPTITYLMQQVRDLQEKYDKVKKDVNDQISVEELANHIKPQVVRAVLTTGEVGTQIAVFKQRVITAEADLNESVKKWKDSGDNLKRTVDEVTGMKDKVCAHITTVETTMKSLNTELETFKKSQEYVQQEEGKRRKLRDGVMQLVQEFTK